MRIILNGHPDVIREYLDSALAALDGDRDRAVLWAVNDGDCIDGDPLTEIEFCVDDTLPRDAALYVEED